jgi:voltage-gated potassium channel
MTSRQSRLEALVFLVILYSIVTFVLELESDDADSDFFLWSERLVAVFFTIEYLVRWVASRTLSYPLRPIAIIDLLATLPFYLAFMVDLRTLRLVRAARMLRLLKLYRYTSAMQRIREAFHSVRYEFGVIGFAVLTLGWICSVAVYELERDAQPQAFAHYSDAAWYTVVTLTTVGYGDKVPATGGGKLVAVVMMVTGLGLFGTFVSLLGSAFLEQLRKSRLAAQQAEPASPADAEPPELQPEPIDPAAVLRALEAGTLRSERELTRLLAAACRQLQPSETGES